MCEEQAGPIHHSSSHHAGIFDVLMASLKHQTCQRFRAPDMPRIELRPKKRCLYVHDRVSRPDPRGKKIRVLDSGAGKGLVAVT